VTTHRTLPRPYVLLTAALLAAPAAEAQTAGSDEGTFRVFLQGREIGTETFQIRQSGAGPGAEVNASGTVRLRLPEGTLELTPRLRATGLQADPVSYQVDVGGDSPRRIVGTIGGGRVSARIVTPTGEQLREYVASSGAVVLDEGVAHHYYFLASRRHLQRVPVLVPRENRQVMAALSSAGPEAVQVGGTTVTADRLVVRPAGGAEAHVWVDALNRVLRVEIPDRGYLAVRTEVPR
jgi:hypothetical protein